MKQTDIAIISDLFLYRESSKCIIIVFKLYTSSVEYLSITTWTHWGNNEKTETFSIISPKSVIQKKEKKKKNRKKSSVEKGHKAGTNQSSNVIFFP